MAKRVGQTVWSKLWTNFTNALTREPQKVFVGSDSVGNRFYEYKGTRSARSNIRRGFEPTPGAEKPTLEWEAWLKGTRRFPPSEDEIAFNKQKQQTQLAEDAVTEKRAPKIGTTGKGAADIDRPKSYPKYDDLEINPGMPGLNKVLEGVLRFRKTVRGDLVKQFERIRDNPNPTAVFFTCMDSRMLPARFTQSQVGDMFVVRNSGNMIPHAANYGISGYEVSVTTEPAALELAVKRGHINHVIVCGHSDCKAINTLYNIHTCPKNFDPESPMDHWLRRHGYSSIKKLEQRLKSDPTSKLEFAAENPLLLNFTAVIDPDNKFNIEDKLSQINTLQQLVHISSHGFLLEFLEKRQVFLHAMWFDVYTGNMYMFSKERSHFVLVDEDSVPSLVTEVDREMHSEATMLRRALNTYPNLASLTGIRGKSIYAKPKRFYKQVGVVDETDENGNTKYSVLLDKYKLKTQAGNVLKVDSEPLALAIAQEWDSQKEHINKPLMRLTGLTFTSVDNPLNETKESLTEKIMEYLDTDTLLYFASEPEKLVKLQHERWAPVLKWVNDAHGLDIRATDNIMDLPKITDVDRESVKRWLLAHNFWTLNGLQYGVEGAKSIIVTMALMGCRISAEEATELSRLEQIYQTKVWGNVEWSHDIEHQETCCRLAASLLFYHFTSSTDVLKQKTVSN